MKKLKRIPRFKNEEAERKFWATHDTVDYFDAARIKKGTFPNLKPTTESISLRLPEYLLARIKEQANAKDVPYQSLMKIYLANQIDREIGQAL